MGVTIEKRVANVSLKTVATRFSSFAEYGFVKKVNSVLCALTMIGAPLFA